MGPVEVFSKPFDNEIRNVFEESLHEQVNN